MIKDLHEVRPWRWPKFNLETELVCPHCGTAHMDTAFLDWAHDLRLRMNVPWPITSAYRCPTHERAKNRRIDGSHPSGQAMDIALNLGNAARLLEHVFDPENGAFGIGIKQHGPYAGRFIHIDRWDNATYRPKDRKTVWTYS